LHGHSGAGFVSKSKYMFGRVSIQLKLVEGDSAGTVTAFYVSELIKYKLKSIILFYYHSSIFEKKIH